MKDTPFDLEGMELISAEEAARRFHRSQACIRQMVSDGRVESTLIDGLIHVSADSLRKWVENSLISSGEAARLLHVSETTLAAWTRQGIISCEHRGSWWRWFRYRKVRALMREFDSNGERSVTVKEAAECLGCSLVHIYVMMGQGRLKVYGTKNNYRVDWESLLQFQKESEIPEGYVTTKCAAARLGVSIWAVRRIPGVVRKGKYAYISNEDLKREMARRRGFGKKAASCAIGV